jgi:hypothetical protein
MAKVLTLTDEEIVVTKLQPLSPVMTATPEDADGTDGEADADGTDGTDGDADADGTDGTDGGDTDGTDGEADADGTDGTDV